MKKIFIFLFLFGLTGICGCREDSAGEDKGVSFEYEKGFKGKGLKVIMRVDRLDVSVADTLLVEFEAVGGSDTAVTFPDFTGVLGKFDVIDTQIFDERLVEGGDVVRGQRIRLEPMITGKTELPVFRFEYVLKGQTESKELATEPVDIEVTSILGDFSKDNKIAEIEGVVGLRDNKALIWVSVIVVLVLLAVAAVFIVNAVFKPIKKSDKAVRVFRSAHEIAFERLKELEGEGLVSAGLLKEFYERVSNILRYYIEDRFRIKAPERTTEEFLNELKYDYTLAAGDKASLEQFLRHCDLVKFAKHEPDDEQVRRTLDLVTDFIDRTKSDDSLIEVKVS